MWGNVRFPQGGIGITVSAANSALSRTRFDAVEFSKRELTADEIDEVGATMDKAHAAHKVAHATRKGMSRVEGAVGRSASVVTNERLQRLWTSIQSASLSFMATLMGIDITDPAYPGLVEKTDSVEKENEYMARVPLFHDKARAIDGYRKIQPIIKSFDETLKSVEGQRHGLVIRRLAKEYAALDQGDAGLEKKAQELATAHSNLVELCFSSYREGRSFTSEEDARLTQAQWMFAAM